MGKKAQLRAQKAQEARNQRYTYVTLVHDRQTSELLIEHPFVSYIEAFGIISYAEAIARARSEDIGHLEIEDP